MTRYHESLHCLYCISCILELALEIDDSDLNVQRARLAVHEPRSVEGMDVQLEHVGMEVTGGFSLKGTVEVFKKDVFFLLG